MEDFFKKLGGGDKKKQNNNNGMKNPFAKINLGGGKKFSGEGQSLGGSQPGTVLQISLNHPGSLGIKVEKTLRGGAIVASVVPSSQGSDAGLIRGDCICIPGTDGTEEMHFDQFMALASSNRRPFNFEVRRIQGANHYTSKSNNNNNKTVTTTTQSSNNNAFTKPNNNNNKALSADAYARKQAVIAAAEARNKKHKARTRPIPKYDTIDKTKFLSAADRQKLELEQKQRLEQLHAQGPQSEEARQAVQTAKHMEAKSVQKMGFNMYEVRKMTGGQAKNATMDSKHGTIDAGSTTTMPTTTNTTTPAPNPVRPPVSPTAATEQHDHSSIHESFDEAFATIISNSNSVKSISTMRKLIENAITKGRTEAKFRRVRLSNAKIQELIADVHGALELMMAFGFVLHEEDNETFLVYPVEVDRPEWITRGLERMEAFEKHGI